MFALRRPTVCRLRCKFHIRNNDYLIHISKSKFLSTNVKVHRSHLDRFIMYSEPIIEICRHLILPALESYDTSRHLFTRRILSLFFELRRIAVNNENFHVTRRLG
jgi:hypothetical protein